MNKKQLLPLVSLFAALLYVTCIYAKENRDVLLAYGDSITHGYRNTPYSHFLQNKLDKGGFDAAVVNSGVNGELTGEGAARLAGVLQRTKPKYVFIMEGANDAIKNVSLKEIEENLTQMVVEAKRYGAIPMISTVTPNTRKDRVLSVIPEKINPIIKRLAEEHQVVLVDNYTLLNSKWNKVQWDGLHPHNYGQLVMAEGWFRAYKAHEAMLERKTKTKLWAIGVLLALMTLVSVVMLRSKKKL